MSKIFISGIEQEKGFPTCSLENLSSFDLISYQNLKSQFIYLRRAPSNFGDIDSKKISQVWIYTFLQPMLKKTRHHVCKKILTNSDQKSSWSDQRLLFYGKLKLCAIQFSCLPHHLTKYLNITNDIKVIELDKQYIQAMI